VKTCESVGVSESSLGKCEEIKKEGGEGEDERIETVLGRRFVLPHGTKMEDYSLLYIGDEGLTLTNLMMTHSISHVCN